MAKEFGRYTCRSTYSEEDQKHVGLYIEFARPGW